MVRKVALRASSGTPRPPAARCAKSRLRSPSDPLRSSAAQCVGRQERYQEWEALNGATHGLYSARIELVKNCIHLSGSDQLVQVVLFNSGNPAQQQPGGFCVSLAAPPSHLNQRVKS